MVLVAFLDRPYLAATVSQMLLVLTGFAIVRRMEHRIDPLNPIVILLALYPLFYTVQISQTRAFADAFSRLIPAASHIDESAQLSAARLETAALLMVLIGYVLAPRARRKGPGGQKKRLSSAPTHWRVRTLAIVGLSATLFLVFIARSGGPSTVLANIFNRTVYFEGDNYFALAPLILLGACAGQHVLDGRWPPRRSVVIVAVTGVLLCLLTGSKANIVVAVILFAAITSIHGRDIPWRLVFPAVLLVIGSLAIYDLYFRNALPRNVSLGTVIEEQGGVVAASTSAFAGNAFFAHQALALAIEHFPDRVPYTGLDSARALLTAPVPRFILPSKAPAPSAAFTNAFAPAILRSGTSIPPTALGELYMSHGIVPVLLGSALAGNWLARAYRRRHESPWRLFVCALTAACAFHFIRGESFGGLVVFGMFAIGGAGVLLRQRGQPRDPIASPVLSATEDLNQ